MSKIITIPKDLVKKGELVLISRESYEKLLRLQEKRKWEEKDTDEAIKVFEVEEKEKKLIEINSLADID